MIPFVSVIIPVYNAEKYLRACLDSVVAQSLREIEIICVDDGSTDASAAILREYAARDPRVRVITQENRYAGAARNAGMKIARGDYLSFLDADDVFEPDMLRKMFLDAETRAADVVICRADRFSDSLEARTPAPWTVRTELLDVPATTVFSYKNFRRDAFTFCIGWTWDKLFSRRFVEAQGLTFSETRSTNDAYFTFLAVLFARRISFVDRVLVHQRERFDSLSRTREKDPLCYWQVVRDMKHAILARPGLWDEVGDAFMRWLAGFALWQAESLAPDARERQIAYFRDVAAPEFDFLSWLDLNAFTPEMRRVRSWLTAAPPPPLVSVIIPVYNVEKYLRECLDSVVNQTLKDIEIICVNDGSTDSSLKILEEYASKDSRIKIISRENKGYGFSVNEGIDSSHGRYIGIVEPDDFAELSMYEKLVRAAQEFNRPWVVCFYYLYEETKRRPCYQFNSWRPSKPILLNPKANTDCVIFGPAIWAAIYDRRWLNENNIRCLESPGASFQDTGFSIKCFLAAETVLYIPEILLNYRISNPNSSVKDKRKLFCVFDEFEEIERWMERRKISSKEKWALVLRRKFYVYKWNESRVDIHSRQELFEKSRLEFSESLKRFHGERPKGIPEQEWTEILCRVKSIPLVSVVIPVYNTGKYLRRCLDSVVNQTLKEIEIICVDDGSSDSSPRILEEYAAKDPRIRVIRQNNLGTSQTRKNGIAASRGAFLMFLDGDDEFVPTACEKALSAASRSGADIVQFGTEIVNVAGVPHERIAMNEKMLEPFSGKIDCENLVEACWVKKKFSGNLGNKIFRGDLARKAFGCVEDGYFCRAEDWYAFFIIAYFSRSYFGIADKLYRYNFGIGVIGGNKLTMKKFDALLSQKKVFEALKSFLGTRGDGKHYQNSLETIRAIFLGQCLHAWLSTLSQEDAVGAFPKLIDTWGFEEVLVSLAKSEWESYADFSETAASAFTSNSRKERRRIKTIAFYYRCIANGGAQRVVADLCNLFAEKKNGNGAYAFNVVCITDAEFLGVKGDYPLSARVARAYLPAYAKSSREKYRDRFHAWHEIISEHEIDAVVSGLWTEPVTFWDALCVKGHPRRPYFLTHSHSYNAIPYLFGEKAPKRIDALYRVSDGAVALSDCDRRHIEKVNPRVRTIVNPLAFAPRKIGESSREPNSVVWCGRISGEKRPLDVVRMMKSVVAEIPDAKLRLVGGGDGALMRATAELVREQGLEKNVELVGFTHDVAAYYSKASVFVSTAEYEGSPLTFGEAMAHGVPIVSYEMPWLTFMRDGRGIVPVERLNPDALAREVVRLLKNPAEARELGMRGREQIIEINDVDIVAEWENLFDEIAGVPVKNRELSREECAELDAINERFVGVFRGMREERRRSQNGIRADSRESAVGAPGSGRNAAFPLPRFVVRLGALFILNKAARKRWRERHMDLTPRDGIDVNAHPELRRDSALKRFAVRAASLFIFSKKKRKAFRARHLNLTPRDGVDVRALSSWELARLREAKRSRSALRRVFDALVPATRGKIAHAERHLLRATEEQTRILLDELRRVREDAAETRRELARMREEQARSREELLLRTLALKRSARDAEENLQARLEQVSERMKTALERGKIDKIEKTADRMEAWLDYSLLGDALPGFREKLRESIPTASRESLDELFRTGTDSPCVADCRNRLVARIRSAFSYKDAAYYERVPVAERERELKLWFKLRSGCDLDLENPKTFNEKIQWLKLYDSTPLKTRLADKYEARAWIKEKIGEKYLIPLLGVWDSFDEIDFDKLPEKFVLKTTHGSGYNVVVKDKSKFDKAEAKKKITDWLSRKFEYQGGFEMHYAGIKPRVIAEEFLDIDESGAYEWQAFCFNGKPKFILVIEGGAHAGVPGRRYYYDTNWKKLPFTSLADSLPEGEIEMPERFSEFMDCAKKLAADFLHVRVDFYLLRDGSWKAGELTFTTASGQMRIYPKSYDRVIGDMLELPTDRP